VSEDAAPLYFVYLVECADGTLYTGIARDVARRVAQHNRGTGARYTRGRGPVTVVAQRGPLSRGEALRLERAVKATPRERKRAALEGR
jgi:putative endonuclease